VYDVDSNMFLVSDMSEQYTDIKI